MITASGSVELWHPGCWKLRAVPILVESKHPPAIIAPRRMSRWIPASAAAAVLVTIGVVRWSHADAAVLANVELVSTESVQVRETIATQDIVPPAPIETPLQKRYAIPDHLDTVFTSLSGWTHPVTSSAELMPEQASRHFGASRIGIERTECGEGHCGVDLDGPRGRPIVAVAGGVVVRVERSELGADGKSGRYVRIEHDDGTLTAYMHMDDVAEDLEVGNHVAGGQYLGTLGATAVYSAPPHLHFSLEVPNHPGSHGDSTDTHYVDPAPFLVRATILKVPVRRHAVKPAF